MKKILGVMLLGIFAWVGQAWAVTSAEIAGKYTIIKGVNPDGSTYDGSVSIRPDPSGGVSITWDDNSVGVGMIEGDRLYIGMVYEKRSVVMVMTINKDGTITGKWIQRTEPGSGIEHWKKR